MIICDPKFFDEFFLGNRPDFFVEGFSLKGEFHNTKVGYGYLSILVGHILKSKMICEFSVELIK